MIESGRVVLLTHKVHDQVDLWDNDGAKSQREQEERRQQPVHRWSFPPRQTVELPEPLWFSISILPAIRASVVDRCGVEEASVLVIARESWRACAALAWLAVDEEGHFRVRP